MKRIRILFVSLLALAGGAMANPPGPDITASQVPVTGDGHFGGASHYHTALTFSDPEKVQNARYVDPDGGGSVQLGGDCTTPFTATVFHRKKVKEAHADDCEARPHLSHWHFLDGIFGDRAGNSTVELYVPKPGATVTGTSAPPGVTVATATAPSPGGAGTTVTVKIQNRTGKAAPVRVSVDPEGDLFLYDIEQQPAEDRARRLPVVALVLLALLLAGAVAWGLRRRRIHSVPGR